MPQVDERTDPTEIAIAEVLPMAIPEEVRTLAALAREALPTYPSSHQAATWAAMTSHGDPDGRG